MSASRLTVVDAGPLTLDKSKIVAFAPGTGIKGDVSSLDDLDRLFAQITREKEKLDVVFANAPAAGEQRFNMARGKRGRSAATGNRLYMKDLTRGLPPAS
jgi:hypothetical protein